MALNTSSNHLIDQAIDYYSWTLTFSGKKKLLLNMRRTHIEIFVSLFIFDYRRFTDQGLALCRFTEIHYHHYLDLFVHCMDRPKNNAKVSNIHYIWQAW